MILNPSVVYDCEVYPNVFTLVAEDLHSTVSCCFEISERRNDLRQLVEWLESLSLNGVPMIGFNNVGFDYALIHHILSNPGSVTAESIYQVCHQIINSNDRFEHAIWPSDRFIPQIDLYLIHHFDNQARRTSLKALQFAMRSESVEDLPYTPGTPLIAPQLPVLIGYNGHDVRETKKFAHRSMEALEFRLSMVDELGPEVMNYNDTKIGKKYFAKKLGDDLCYTRVSGRRVPRQTPRPSMKLADVILPYIDFRQPEFKRVLEWLKAQEITETKGVFTDVSATINGFTFDFSTGGLHASVKNRAFKTNDTHEIIDIDVVSFYPSIAIANNLAPEHLGQAFVTTYDALRKERVSHAKGTAMNAALKLALNGVYGDSNSKFSVFYDPQYTMSITINGQLLLCMLAECLLMIPGLEIIQCNTDGITVYMPRQYLQQFATLKKQWEDFTMMELEEIVYSEMFVRDVNNYLAVDMAGKVKRKNAFNSFPSPKDYDGWWHKNHSSLVIPAAAEAALLYDEDIRQFVENHTDPFDFMIRCKTQKGTTAYIGDDPQQSTLRYYIAKDGALLVKVSPPAKNYKVGDYKRKSKLSDYEFNAINRTLNGEWDERIHTKNKSKYEIRRTGVNAGWFVKPCNKASDFDWNSLDREYYILEAEKLVESVEG